MVLDLVAKKKKEKTPKPQKAEVLFPCGQLGLQGGARQCAVHWWCAGPRLRASRKGRLQLPHPGE